MRPAGRIARGAARIAAGDSADQKLKDAKKCIFMHKVYSVCDVKILK